MADFEGYNTVFLIILTFVIVILVRASFGREPIKSRLPPSPRALPVIGHLHLIAPLLHQAFQKLANKHGPIMHLFLGSVPCVVVSSSDIAKEFLKTNENSFLNRPKLTSVDYITHGADFAFSPYGPYWKFMKKLCMSQLLCGRVLDELLHIRQQEIKKLVKSLYEKAEIGEVVNMGVELNKMTNNIITQMVVRQNQGEDSEIRKMLQELQDVSGKFNLSDYFWFCKNLDLQGLQKRYKQAHEKADKVLNRIIREHENARRNGGKSVKDILDILLDTEEDGSSEIRLTREQIKAFILDVFSGGTDTTAVTAEWALAELINHPMVMIKARQEIDSVVGKNRLVTEADTSNLPYLQAIVKESLRLHPTGPILLRESTQNCTVAGYEIPAKTRLFVNVWAIGRDPNSWEDPMEFRPERFLGSKAMDVRGQHYEFLPFGSGRRGCPGISLALSVLQSSLAAMIQCFEWKVDGERVDMEEAAGLTLHRASPLVCVPVSRLHLQPSPSS